MAYWWLLRKPAGLDLAAVPLAAWPIGLGLAAFGQVSKLLGRTLEVVCRSCWCQCTCCLMHTPSPHHAARRRPPNARLLLPP